MTFQIFLTKRAHKALRSLPNRLRRRIEEKIKLLAEDPLPRGVAKLIGLEHAYRLRIGDYRILYSIRWREKIIIIFRIALRRKAYKSK